MSLLSKELDEEAGGIPHQLNFWNVRFLIILSRKIHKLHSIITISLGTGEGVLILRVKEHLRAVIILLPHKENKITPVTRTYRRYGFLL